MDPTNAETIGLNYDGTLPQFKKNTLTVDTSRHTGHARSGSNKENPNLLSPNTIISGHSGGQDDRKNSTASALTDDTLVPSEPASPFTPLTSADKGKQREDTSLFVPVRTPSYDYGTINIAPSPSEPVQAFGSPRDRAITLERVRRTTPQLVNEVQKLQQVSTWVDEEAQVVYYFGHRLQYRSLFVRCPALLADYNGIQIEPRPSRSWWRPNDLNRRNVGVVYAIYAIGMLFFYLYGPHLAPKVFP